MTSQPAATWRASSGALPLALAGLAAAGAAQALLEQRPWIGVGGFAVGALLSALSARRTTPVPELPIAAPQRLSGRAMAVFSIGILLCAAAGGLVFLRHRPLLTHAVWAGGLLALVASAGLAPRGVRAVQPLVPWQRGALLGVLTLAAVLFGWALTSVPPEVHGDDAEVGLDAARLLLVDFNLFAPGWFELPRFHALSKAIGLQLFGVNLLGLRITSAALGLAGVGLLFLVTHRLWSADLALLAAALLAGQRFYVHLSRAGYIYIDTPVLSLVVLWLFLRAWQERRTGAAILCGVALGVGIQTYYASRLVPILLALTWLIWLASTPRRAWRDQLWPFALIALTALAVAAPMFGFSAHDWGDFWRRTRDTSIFAAAARRHVAAGYGTSDFAIILVKQLQAAVSLFNRTGDTSVQYGLRGALLEPVSAALFIAGFGIALARLRERRAGVVVLWLAGPLIAGAALTVDTPFYPRISGIVPFAVLLVAMALAHALHVLRAAVPQPAGRWAVGTLCGAALTLILIDNARSYFIDYAPRHRHSPAVEIATFVRRHGAGKTTYMVGGAPGFYIKHGAIAFLTWGELTRDVIDLEGFLRHPPDPHASAFVIMPQGKDLIGRLEAAVGSLDVHRHLNRHGEVAFYGAVPRVAGSAADPPEYLRQAAEPSAGASALDAVLAVVRRLLIALMIGTGVVSIGLALAAWWRGSRPPGPRAPRQSWGMRLAHWRARLFGPDAHERAIALPGGATALLLAAVLAVALGLRVYRLADLPAGFYCDEAGNGYNAHALLHSGRDETGAHWPLYVWSFDVSYKNPIFIYSAMLPMAVLGPTELAVRLTAALWGAATVLALFGLGRALMGPLVGLAAALLLAVCPWHLHFSRIGYELITFPCVFALALTALVRWSRGQPTLGYGGVLLGLCLYTYAPAKLFVPLFGAGFAILYRRALWRRRRETLLAGALAALTAAPAVIFDLTHTHRAATYLAATGAWAGSGGLLALAQQFVDNYAAFFSPTFLFAASDDPILRHAVHEHGQLYPFFLPLLALGALTVILRRDRALYLVPLWLILYPVAAALMNEIPSASRGIIGAAGFCLLAAIGAGAALRLIGAVTSRRAVAWGLQGAAVGAALLVLVPAASAYWRLYRDTYPRYSASGYDGFQFGHRRVLEVFRERYDEFDRLLLSTRLNNQPRVFLDFYDGLRQPVRPGAPPFAAREKMLVGNPEAYVHFDPPQRPRLFAVLPEEAGLFGDGQVLEEVVDPGGRTAFVIVAATRLKDFVSAWYVAGPLPASDSTPPPQWSGDGPPDAPPGGVHWRQYNAPFASVRLNDFFTGNAEDACAWAVNAVDSDGARTVRAVAGFDDHGELWLNGARVALQRRAGESQTLIDQESATVALQPGRNVVAIRCCETVGDWRFYFRLENPDGTPADGLTWVYRPRPRSG